MKTLYISDLDGTLLNSQGKISDYSIKTINNLINEGMIFTYATARSLVSASPVTRGLIKNLDRRKNEEIPEGDRQCTAAHQNKNQGFSK